MNDFLQYACEQKNKNDIILSELLRGGKFRSDHTPMV